MTLITALVGVVPTFQTGCSAAQHNRAVLQLSAFNGDIPRGIAKSVLLHEGSVVLLVDNNQPRLFKRHKNRGAGTKDNGGGAPACSRPHPITLSTTHTRVQREHGSIKTCLKSRQCLRSEGNLGQQYQRLLLAFEASRNGL